MSLLDDLQKAELATAREKDCPLCDFILSIEDDDTRNHLIAGATGTIGLNTLVLILKGHVGVDHRGRSLIGRRTIEKHREGNHTP